MLLPLRRLISKKKSSYPTFPFWWTSGPPWCPPCRQIAPSLDALAAEYAGKAKIVKVDVDDEPDVASRYGISGIPALLLFKGGQQVGQLTGAHPKANIAKLIAEAL